MNKHFLQQLLEEVGIECQSYSGRAMYGDSCLGIRLNDAAGFGNFLCKIAQYMYDLGSDSWDEINGRYPEVEQNAKEVAVALRNFRMDDLGRDSIIYFPGVPFVDENEIE